MFRLVSVSFLMFWYFSASVYVIYAQCGADGTKPCAITPKTNSPTKSSKVNPPKKTVPNKPSSKTAAVAGTESGAKKTYALVITENANLRESPTVYSGSIREVGLNEKLLLIQEEPMGPWYKVFDSKTKIEGWLHGNTIEIVYGENKNGNKRTPSEAVIKTKINICTEDVGERVKNAGEIYRISVVAGDKETALQQLDLMKATVLQYRRCLNTGLRLKTITEEERATFLRGLQLVKESLDSFEERRKNLTETPE